MAKRDTYHQAVKRALIQDGWTVTDDPLRLQFGGLDFYVDLGAERLFAAEKGAVRIAVEVKSFLGYSDVSEFYTALGQYLSYRIALSSLQPQRALFLAIPGDTWKSFFSLPFTQEALRQHEVNVLVCDIKREVIETWIRSPRTGVTSGES